MATLQVNGSAVTASSTNNNGGSVVHGGNIAGTLLNNQALGNDIVQNNQVVRSQHSGVQSALKGSGVAATSVADDGNGFCVFTKNSHGLSVGDILYFSGATADSLNTVHVITAKDDNTFTTDVAYAASATAGTYKLTNGNFATMTKEKFIITRVTDEIAGVANTVMRSGAADMGERRSINKREYIKSANLTKVVWEVTAGKDSPVYTYTVQNRTSGWHDIANNTAATSTDDKAANPTRAIPGRLTFRTGAPAPTVTSYEAKTGG